MVGGFELAAVGCDVTGVTVGLSVTAVTTVGGSLTATGGSVGSTGGSVGSIGGSVGSIGGSVGSAGGSVGSIGESVGSIGGSVGSTGGSLGSITGSAGSLIGATGFVDVTVGARVFRPEGLVLGKVVATSVGGTDVLSVGTCVGSTTSVGAGVSIGSIIVFSVGGNVKTGGGVSGTGAGSGFNVSITPSKLDALVGGVVGGSVSTPSKLSACGGRVGPTGRNDGCGVCWTDFEEEDDLEDFFDLIPPSSLFEPLFDLLLLLLLLLLLDDE